MRDLTPAADPAEALRERAGELTSRILEILGEPGLLRTGERIHDLRVATKKLRALLDLVEALPDSDRLAPFGRVVRRTARRASLLRDLQVHVVLVLELSAAERSRLVPWLEELFERERAAASELEARAPKLARRIAKRSRLFGKTTADAPAAVVRKVAAGWAERARGEVLEALRRTPDEDALHEVRKRTKRWVHGEEIRISLAGEPASEESKLARRLASALGKWHDALRGVELLDRRVRAGTESDEDAPLVATLLGLHRAFEAERERQLAQVRAAAEALLAAAEPARRRGPREARPSAERRPPAARSARAR